MLLNFSRYSDGSRSPSPESKQARFQNMDDGDIRDLGVGYYNFSADESTRQQQMGILNTLRERTKETRQMKQQKETNKACFEKIFSRSTKYKLNYILKGNS